MLALIATLPFGTDAKRRPKPLPCPGGSFAIEGAPLGTAVSVSPDVLAVATAGVSFTSACAPATPKIKPTRKKGTRVRVKWPSCPGFKGPVRIVAFIEPGCTVVAGKLRARGTRRTFRGTLTSPGSTPVPGTCGDGSIDAGEACDGAGTCPDGEECSGCQCVPSESPLCTVASTCEERTFCSADRQCRCLGSAEGDVRCGRPPSCAVQRCRTSADCADMGVGYFCDAPNSGCCADAEESRCIAPCTPACPRDQQCGYACCANGLVCSHGERCMPPGVEYPLPRMDLEARRFIEQAERARVGYPADADGDGTFDYQLTRAADGSSAGESDEDGDGTAEYRAVRDAAGNETVEIDSDSDGRPETTIDATVGPPPKRVRLTDSDADGTMDARRTDTFDTVAGTVRVVEERDPEGDGSFVVVADQVVPIGLDGGASGCDGTQGFPEETGGEQIRVGGISIPVGGGGGRCDAPRADRLLRALSCVLSDGARCLRNTNAGLHKRLFDAVADEDVLIMACGNPCGNKYATTTGGPGSFRDGHLNFNTSRMDSLTGDELCDIMLHEMLHWSGEGFSDDHNGGVDKTWSCGRYCGRCTAPPGPTPPAGTPTGPNADCARCAGTDAEKRRCGIQKEEVDLGCPALDLCHAGLAGNRNCETCRGLKEKFCDGTPAPAEAAFRCCQTCPDDFPTNDKPCVGSGTTPGSCATKPPDCP